MMLSSLAFLDHFHLRVKDTYIFHRTSSSVLSKGLEELNLSDTCPAVVCGVVFLALNAPFARFDADDFLIPPVSDNDKSLGPQ